MTADPVRELRTREMEKKRARSDDHYVQALLAGKAPSAVAFCTALDMGHEGDAALSAARTLDQAASNFFAQQPTDDAPPAA